MKFYKKAEYTIQGKTHFFFQQTLHETSVSYYLIFAALSFRNHSFS